MTVATTEQETNLSADYRRGWCEGASAVLAELMGRDSGGFLSGVKDKNGVPEEWLALGFIIEVITDVQRTPKAPREPVTT